MNYTISVVIPAYNRAHGIGRCLTSLFQCAECRYSEIIIVDDGSSDNLEEVVTQWMKVHPGKIIYLKQPKNGGVSRTRNRALPYLTGDYVWFVDSDDVVFENGLNRVLRYLDVAHPDIYRFAWCRIRDGETICPEAKENLDLPPVLFDVQNCSCEILKRIDKISQLWNAVYRRDILDGIEFLPGLANGEDVLYSRTAFVRARTVMVDESNIVYGYTMTEGSASSVPTNRMFRGCVRCSCELAKLYSNAALFDLRWRPLALAYVWSFYPRLLCYIGDDAFRGDRLPFIQTAFYRIFVSNKVRSLCSRMLALSVWKIGTKRAFLFYYRLYIIFTLLFTTTGQRKIVSRFVKTAKAYLGTIDHKRMKKEMA